MKEIAVLTTTRAEYGLLRLLVSRLMENSQINVNFLVTGMHLSEAYGSTYREIENDNMPILCKIPILSSDNSSQGISETMGRAITEFGKLFSKYRPDALIVLGDRYETLAVCCAAMTARIPIVHLHGGETTEGAIDEAARHAITKMSWLHFTSTEQYRRRVIQMGEQPENVYCVGALGVENVLSQELFSKGEICRQLGLDWNQPYAVMTFHPVTLDDCVEEQTAEILKVLDACPKMQFIVTKANADVGGAYINKMLDLYARDHGHVFLFSSLGAKRYLSAVKYAEYVIGNSSSGIIEVPSFHVPTVNIGTRQKGRIHGLSVLDCTCKSEDILMTIKETEKSAFKQKLMQAKNPYERTDTSKQISHILLQRLEEFSGSLYKHFYDIV